jgi:hypothetical protein
MLDDRNAMRDRAVLGNNQSPFEFLTHWRARTTSLQTAKQICVTLEAVEHLTYNWRPTPCPLSARSWCLAFL